MAKTKSLQRKVVRKNKRANFDKYEMYRDAVQSPEVDVEFFERVYKELRGKKAVQFREDFCGTFLLSHAWVSSHRNNRAWAVDIDPEPLEYGRNYYWDELTPSAQKRLKIFEGNVLTGQLPDADVAAALNFSYYCFKKREVLKTYFANARRSLRKNGLFFIDAFGGKQCADAVEDVLVRKNYTYYWDQDNFDPVTNEAKFHIHFKPKGQKKIQNVFSYDWRMWSIPELRDILEEVGFKKTHVYWEGTRRNGEGNGKFSRTEQGEACDSWIAYIVAEK